METTQQLIANLFFRMLLEIINKFVVQFISIVWEKLSVF